MATVLSKFALTKWRLKQHLQSQFGGERFQITFN